MAAHAATKPVTRARRPAGSVGDPILASKITAPGVPDWVLHRPRVTKLLAEGTRWCPLTVVTGPLGAGKTMALALWAAAEAGPVAWVSLDEYDNRPGVFWSCVVAALRRSGVAVPRALSPAARGRAGEHVFLLRLAAVLAARNPPVTLVLDDVQLLTEPKVLSGLDFLVRNAGPGLRLVACSQTDPLLPLHRYRLAGELAEIQAADLAFTATEAGLLLARHGCALSAESVECLVRQTEGWAAGLRLAGISMATHPSPDRFVTELLGEDSALAGYLAEEVLGRQRPEVLELLLSTCILQRVNAEAASELSGHEQAGRILQALAHDNAFVQPIGGGWYRYHTLFAEVLRCKLRREYPERIAPLHRRAARWYERNGQLTDAVRHAGQAGDWQLAAKIAVDGLAIGKIIEPQGGQSLADEFASMPHSAAWTEPQPYLVCAALALSGGRAESAAATLDTADGILDRLPADQETAARLAAAMIRLAASRRAADLTMTSEAVARAEALVIQMPDSKLARHPDVRARVLSARGTVALWAGRFDEAAGILASAAAASAASGETHEQANCLGHFALAEALRGQLCRAARVADQATAARAGDGQPPIQQPNPAALVALAWVSLEHHKAREARNRLRQADAALAAGPDRLIEAVACLTAAGIGLAEERAEVAAQFVAKARAKGSVPAWLEQRLDLIESRAFAAAGNIQAALSAASRAGHDTSPQVAVVLAHAWAVAGDGNSARRALEPALAAPGRLPERMRLQAWLVDARLSYGSGDHARGHRSLTAALRLAEREQLKLPFATERGWLGPVLRQDPELAYAYHQLLAPALPPAQLAGPGQAPVLVVEPLTKREREVLRHVSGMLNTAEIAEEMYISVNTVKAHLKSVNRKLAAAHRGEAVRRARELELI